MRRFVLKGYQTFTPEEWGGLGIPSKWDLCKAQMAPWHKAMISLAEGGDEVASVALRRWSTSTPIERGLDTNSIETRLLYSSFLTDCGLAEQSEKDIESALATWQSHGQPIRHRERYKVLTRNGYLTFSSLLDRITAGQVYTSYYDVEKRMERGYNHSLKFPERTAKLRAFALRYLKVLQLTPEEASDGLSPKLTPTGFPKPSASVIRWYKVRGARAQDGTPLGLDRVVPGPRCFTGTINGAVMGWIEQPFGVEPPSD
jgi:hypothetical protein